MQEAGRLLVKDAPRDGCVEEEESANTTMAYEETLRYLADQCDAFSGAPLAAVPSRAAASRALERAVSTYSIDLERQDDTDTSVQNKGKQDALAMFNCVVTLEDLEHAVEDVWKTTTTTTPLQLSSNLMAQNRTLV